MRSWSVRKNEWPNMKRVIIFSALVAGACGAAQRGSEIRQSAQPAEQRVKNGMNPARVRAGDPDWQRAEKEVYAARTVLDARLAKYSPSELRKFVLRAGNPRRNSIALTFDDGPHPAYTQKLLDILKSENVPATFFVVGFMADKYPGLVRAIRAGGNEIGNHTYSHVNLSRLSSVDVLAEYEACSDVIVRLTGRAPRYCRPPGGDFNRGVLERAAGLGMTTVLWTDDPKDYANPGDQTLYDREVGKLAPGAIVLLHDGSKNTVDTLPRFIQAAKRRGFRFVSLGVLQRQ